MYEQWLKTQWQNTLRRDTVPKVTTPNNKGYIVNIEGWGGTCVVVVKDKKGNEVKSVELAKWNENPKHYEDLYGEIPPVPAQPAQPRQIIDKAVPVQPSNPVQPLTTISKAFAITNNKAVIQLPGGKTETYDLTNTAEKKKFEDKYGEIIAVSSVSATVASKTIDAKGITPAIAVNPVLGETITVEGFPTSVGADKGILAERVVMGYGTKTVIAPMAPVIAGNVMLADSEVEVANGEEDVLITITKNTTRQQLEELKKQMKEKDIELSFEDMEYNEKGELTMISGTIKSKDGKSIFVVSDFNKLILTMVRSGNKKYFKVVTRNNKEVI
jgi:hypothetical protein